MAAQELYIKNMVCDRCIWVVRNELERLGYSLALIVAAAGLVPFFGTEFLPPFNEGSLP